MAFNITTNYAGDAALDYVTKAFYEGNTISRNWVTILTNIKDKRNITKLGAGELLQADGCDFDASGDINLTESILDPTAVKVNVQACYSDLESHWEAERMRPGAMNSDLAGLGDFIVDYHVREVAQRIDQLIWSGDTGSGTAALQLFDGFSALLAAGSPITVTGTTLSAANILAELGKVYDAIPEQLIMSSDLKIFVPYSAHKYYQQALATASGDANFNVQNGFAELTYLGIPVVPVRLPNDVMIAGESRNMFVGTDLVSDYSEVRIIDMRETDGSDNVRFKMRFKAGVQIAYENEVVYYA